MDSIKKRNIFRNSLFGFLLAVLMVFTMFSSVITVHASEQTETQSEPTKAEQIVENTKFLTFRKGDTEEYGRFIFACFYVSDEALFDDCTYSVLICPRSYLERVDYCGDYVNVFKELGVQVMTIDVNSDRGVKTDDGAIFKFGIVNILDQNINREFSFVFHATDAEGNTVYFQPQYADYTSLIAQNYTNEELIVMLEQKLAMEDKFDTILLKMNELVDSVWTYLIIGMASIVVVWGAYIGIRIAVAKRKDEKIDAMAMVKQLLIGILIMFVIAMGAPLLIKGLNAWIL